MLHMAATACPPGGLYLWRCRCGAGVEGFRDVASARRDGDAHLAAANDSEATP